MAKKTTKPATKSAKPRKAAAVKVKSYRDIAGNFNNFVFKNVHDRYNLTLSTKTKKKLVAYGPWLATGMLLLLAPELLVLAKDAQFISFSRFIETILFNRTSWVLLIVLFVNCLAIVDAISGLFEQKKRGWNRVYVALLINIGYVLYQCVTRFEMPAAPFLSLILLMFCLFTMLDIRQYYK